MLNPHGESYCLGPSRTSVDIPIRINQTAPVLIELTRIDLCTNTNETIVIPAKQAKALKKQADRQLPKGDVSSPRYLQFHVKQTGFYRLQKVVDESGLEVQRIRSDAFVVACPSATVKPAPAQKCRGELSNLVVQLHGTPPFKLKYSRTVNREDKTFSFQSIQPENFVSPLKGQISDALVTQNNLDLSWARPHQIDVPLNESLNTAGHWLYSIDEVHDALGNSANYSHRPDDDERVVAKRHGPQQIFTVDARPRASLSTNKSPCQLKVARGRSVRLPLVIDDSGQGPSALPFTVLYRFTPTQELQPNGEHSANASVQQMTVRGAVEGPLVNEPGLYTLLSVSSRSCSGEVLEPTSCLLINPPEPSLSVASKDIYDTCAGNPIGLQVDLDLIGTPPFRLNYETYRNREKKVQTYTVLVDGLRHQLEFKPSEAGHYIYRFKSIKDSVYDLKVLSDDSMVLRQDVKPPASARFAQHGFWREVCLDESVPFNVTFQGEGPWDLEYEVVHNGKRQKHEIKGIEGGSHEITIDGLHDGGEYTVALVSVHDSTRCKVFLNEETKIDVRQQRPKAGFGKVEGKRTVTALQGRGVPLPVRLTGQTPWTVKYRHTDSIHPITKILRHNNDHLEVNKPGTYELVDIRDAVCPGVVDESASKFEVEWLPRPSVKVSESAAVDLVGGKYIKKDVCEGDEDATEITLSGKTSHPLLQHTFYSNVSPRHASVLR